MYNFFINKDLPQQYNRRSLRLQDFDYSREGAYFITVVTQNRKSLFGRIRDQEMVLNHAGRMVEQVCREIPQHLDGVSLETYQVMPNHFHAIILLSQPVGTDPQPNIASTVGATLHGRTGQAQRPAPTASPLSLPDVIQRFKSLTTNRYIQGVRQFQWPPFDQRLWQRNYYEHIIRDDKDFQSITEYILANPLNWEKDAEFQQE